MGQDKERIRVWYCFHGEPLLLRKRLPDYIRFGKSLGIKHHIINTNGNLLDEGTAERLVEAGLTEIYIGVDTATESTYDEIRIGGHFQDVVRHINYLLKIKPEHLQVTVQMIELPENRPEKSMFEAYWKQRGTRVFVKREYGLAPETKST